MVLAAKEAVLPVSVYIIRNHQQYSVAVGLWMAGPPYFFKHSLKPKKSRLFCNWTGYLLLTFSWPIIWGVVFLDFVFQTKTCHFSVKTNVNSLINELSLWNMDIDTAIFERSKAIFEMRLLISFKGKWKMFVFFLLFTSMFFLLHSDTPQPLSLPLLLRDPPQDI